jgi:integrase
LIEGISGLQSDALVVVDFGDGELAFARVMRSAGRHLGIAFEQQLVDDGNGGLCTSHRVSPYLLATIGLPSPADPEKSLEEYSNAIPLEELASTLGLTLAPRPAPRNNSPASGSVAAEEVVPTFRQLSTRYLEALQADEEGRISAKRNLRNHVLPRFGQLRLDQVSQADIVAWLTAKVEVEDHPPGTDSRLHFLLNQMWSLAVRLGLPGAEPNPLEGHTWISRRAEPDGALTIVEVEKLVEASRTSHNRQLKFIVLLLMLTGARQGELLKAKWEHVDVDQGVWRIPISDVGTVRELKLSRTTLGLLANLPRWTDCPYLVANPNTKKPYRSVSKSWDVAKTKAGLPYLELEDLRYCDVSTAFDEGQLNEIVRQLSAEHDVEPSSSSSSDDMAYAFSADPAPSPLDRAA